jgi:hypothetical protein
MSARSNAISEGIRVNIKIDGKAWTPIDSFKDSKPEDRHYVVKTKPGGETAVVFGDGRKGRRPLPGSEITASYRDSAGARRNMSRKRLTICFSWDRRCTRAKGG